jgi:hypothetical protein
MNKAPETFDLARLKYPFPAADIEWRIAQSGLKDERPWAKVLAYITSRAVHDRLDEVVGPGNWQMRYVEWNKGAVCEIGIKIDGEWVWKAGGGDPTDYEAFKGMLSSAEKRAGVPWGIGRYLYNLTEDFAECIPYKSGGVPKGYHRGNGKDKAGKEFYFFWKEPILPNWALPAPIAGAVTQDLKKPTMTPEQRAAAGLLSAEQIDVLQRAITQSRISSEEWLRWLPLAYKVPSIYAIKLTMYDGILEAVKIRPETIKKVAAE